MIGMIVVMVSGWEALCFCIFAKVAIRQQTAKYFNFIILVSAAIVYSVHFK